MEAIRTTQNFKDFLNANRAQLHENAIKVEDISSDDDWIKDSKWDEIYLKEVGDNGKV